MLGFSCESYKWNRFAVLSQTPHSCMFWFLDDCWLPKSAGKDHSKAPYSGAARSNASHNGTCLHVCLLHVVR